MIVWLPFAILSLITAVFGWLLFRASRRLLQFDDLFELLVDDIGVNLKYFEKLANTPIIENSPEIFQAHRNMMIMRERLDEFVNRMEEITRRKLRRDGRSPNPPVVI